jgi:hypothetical protein
MELAVFNVRFVPASSYLIYGNDTKLRSPQDIAFAVALFIAKKNGSYVSYYMVWIPPQKELNATAPLST